MPELRKQIIGISPTAYDFSVGDKFVKEIMDKNI
jgi:hypothetical protein